MIPKAHGDSSLFTVKDIDRIKCTQLYAQVEKRAILQKGGTGLDLKRIF